MNVIPYAARYMSGPIIGRALASSARGVAPYIRSLYRNRRAIGAGIGTAAKYASTILSSKRPRSNSLPTPVKTPKLMNPDRRMSTSSRASGSVRSFGSTKKKLFVKQKDTHGGRQGYAPTKVRKRGKRGRKGKGRGKKRGRKSRRKGVSFRIENRGQQSASDCAFVSHGTPLAKMWDCIWLSVVKDLFTQKGQDAFDMTEVIPGINNYFVTVSYYPNFGSTSSTSYNVPTVNGTTTYFALADALLTKYNTVFAPAGVAVFTRPLIDVISLDQYTNSPTDSIQINCAKFYAEKYYLDITTSSVLKLLNVTPATALGVSDVTNDDVGDIHAVPLVGYKYVFKQSTALPNVRQDTPTGWNKMSLPLGTGLVSCNESDLGSGGTSTITNYYKKPPVNGTFSNCGKRMPMHIDPGEIITDKCFYNKTMSLRKWIQLYHDQAVNPTLNINVNLGAMNCIALEHKLFFTGDSNILLNYQQDLYIQTVSHVVPTRPSLTFTQVN